ncbi:DUF2798 domain-containing protein [Pedobacter duraquae]|uniref:Uncharacterized protein DUF2798 n=1 Tax=Pedobacter duraquae TaxID=425511 RepID=A0A4R6IPJ9_9SPHI|nr:DUF2798 domain-containing protein [Pedobacter duraquae]TDO24193.1 uncharacterized protein DUF2798 [Pedobacter duraquae]
MKLSKKQADIVFIILVSICTTAILSFGILCTHHAIDREFFTLWRPDFISGCLISIPTGFILNPLLKKLIDHYTEKDN